MPRRPRIEARTLSTAQLSAVHPFFAGHTLDTGGVLVGCDAITGRPVAVDPWRLYHKGIITNPGMVVVGNVGVGKSALIKTYVSRHLAAGRSAVILDPKGEYDALARAHNVTPLALTPHGSLRLNPLDPALDLDRQQALIGALMTLGLGRPLTPTEHTACAIACRRARGTTLHTLLETLRTPPHEMASQLGLTRAACGPALRECALALGRLVDGELSGLLDGPTSDEINLDAPLVVCDLSRIRHSPALAVVMACLCAWHEQHVIAHPAQRILVIDEAWALIAHPATAEFFQRSWKLARAMGVHNILVVHRLSDLGAAGDAGTRVQAIADGLIADSQLLVVMRQSHTDRAHTNQRIGLSERETELVTHLPRGSALWHIAGTRLVVAHVIADSEAALIDTDHAMRTRPAQAATS